ncbi:MAG: SynChlorMet cassette radical SAM/SPASM protein ScmE [Victivallaceae bacterium]|nr:SynChlorMet cassette radical SAM/SPASM protein ScmE [Victivallaceae bacterium]
MKPLPTPRSVDLNITNRCNLKCSYCSHFSSGSDTGTDLPLEEWLRFMEELNKCAVFDVCLSGGEPLFRKDFRQIVEGVVKNHMRFSVLSNGTLLTGELADFLKSTGRCNSYQVSIDGPGPEAHDACRGKDSFEKALRGLRILLKHKLPATVRVTIHKHNVRQLDEIAELLLEDVGLPSFSTNSAAYMGLCRQNEADVQLNMEEYSCAMEKLLKLANKYNGRISANAGPLSTVRYWMNMEKSIKNGIKSRTGCGKLTSCGGVLSKMAVNADGTMVPCSQMPHIRLGRINQDDLREVWQNHPELKRLRERRDIPLETFEHCQGCEYIPYCRGGCPALAYNLNGEENVPSPDACYRVFKEAGGKLPKLGVCRT